MKKDLIEKSLQQLNSKEVIGVDNNLQENIQSADNKVKKGLNRVHLDTKDFEMNLTLRRMKNPAEILEKMYLLRENRELSDEEKNEEVKKIMNEYMR